MAQNTALFSHTFQGTIWKIYEDAILNQLVIETRDYGTRSVSFSVFDMTSSTFLLYEYSNGEPWWTGIEDVHNGYIFFHRYDQLQFSNHLGISCFSIALKKQMWERNDVVFSGLLPDKILAQKNNSFDFVSISPATGKTLNEAADFAKILNEAPVFNENRKKQVLVPEIFHEGDTYFHVVNKFLFGLHNIIPVKQVEYMEHRDHVFFSYYVPSAQGFTNHLAIVGKEGEIWFSDILGEELKGVGAGTFFVLNENLVYIKNKQSLCVLPL